ncbi:hypothetical protein QR680_017614 [Steinernema hermaphroditum]|uniref:Ionotropic glutamate receptor L-glutamate and glycine-binding domain-containing protein n=1 Tax=Steinernema hermaphroditum TaxID=289476 RepID=A0AA39HF83_9BILA|nr:hypothetical protein QR680_017614 [Steinernema hermaphroditum]
MDPKGVARHLRVGFLEVEMDSVRCFRQIPFQKCRRPGAEVELIHIIFQILGVDFEIIDVQREYGVRNELGSRDENGNWTGMMGLLLDGAIDVSGLSMRIAPEREEFVLFAYPIRYFQTVYITKRPEILETPEFIGATLSLSTWLLFGVLLLLLVLLNLLLRFSAAKKGVTFCGELTKAVWDIISVNLRQSASLPHSPTALFVLNGIYMVACIVLVTCFQSEMYAKLVAPSRYRIPFRNQEELVGALQRREVFMSGYSAHPILCVSPKICEQLTDALRKEPIKVRRVESEVVADIARSGVYQSTMDTAFIPNELSWFSRKRDKIVIRDDLGVAHFASFVFPKRLRRLRDRFNEALMTVLPAVRHITAAHGYRTLKDAYVPSVSTSVLALSLQRHLLQLFAVYALGVAFAIAVFCAELLLGNTFCRLKCPCCRVRPSQMIDRISADREGRTDNSKTNIGPSCSPLL